MQLGKNKRKKVFYTHVHFHEFSKTSVNHNTALVGPKHRSLVKLEKKRQLFSGEARILFNKNTHT